MATPHQQVSDQTNSASSVNGATASAINTSNTDDDNGDGDTGDDPGVSPLNADGTVKYQTYKRAVGEVKRFKSEAQKLKEENEAFKAREKAREEAELEKRGEFDKVKSNLLKELEEERERNKRMAKERADDRKLGAFLATLGGNVSRDYWGLINIDEIAIDPDTGEIDELSVTRSVEKFRTKHGRLIDGVKGPKMYDGSPSPEGKLTLETWRALPLKERKERMGEIYEQLKNE